MVFSSSETLAVSAAAAGCSAARAALAEMRGRCAALELQSTCLQLQLHAGHMDNKLPYGSVVWSTFQRLHLPVILQLQPRVAHSLLRSSTSGGCRWRWR